MATSCLARADDLLLEAVRSNQKTGAVPPSQPSLGTCGSSGVGIAGSGRDLMQPATWGMRRRSYQATPNILRKDGRCEDDVSRGAQLSGAQLSGAQLSGTQLSGAQFA